MLKNVSISRSDVQNPENRLPESLVQAAWTKTKALGILMDFDRSAMNGLATYAEMRDHHDLLVAEYARNRWILTLSDPVFGRFQIPGCEASDARSLVFFSNAALRSVPELANFLSSWRLDSFPLGGSYVSAVVPSDESNPARRAFFEILAENFSRSASSPLKQDIVPALVEAGWVPLSEGKKSDTEVPVGDIPAIVRPVSKADRMKARKYLVGKDADSSAVNRHLNKHVAHYSKFFAFAGETPSSVHLTVSGKSANTTVIRYVQNRIDSSKIDVHPGYFFLNEGDFLPEVPSFGSSDPQALFFSIDAGYAGTGGVGEYFQAVSVKMERLMERAKGNPDIPYFLCVDVTSDLSGIADRMSDFVKRRASLPNLTVFLSSSLTKYNRSERNYHYGIVARYSTVSKTPEERSGDSSDIDRIVSTSYGDLSPLAILQFPRLRLSAVERQRASCEANRNAFMDGFLGQLGDFSAMAFRFEHHSAYSYLILDLPSEIRNPFVSDFLETSVPSEFRGSSFYHDEIRFCDVPEIGCSRFAHTPGGFVNSVRIAWPDAPQTESMVKLGGTLAVKLMKAASER